MNANNPPSLSPRVSVVIPCFNHGKFLDAAVSSVLDQTFDDFEIIVVNDGSTDPMTAALLKTYERPKTRIVHTDNQGLAAARNNGVRAASGSYILPLDADDRIGPTYLERAVAVMDADPEIGIVYCEAEYFGEKSGPWELPPFDMNRMLVHNLIFCSGFFRKTDWEIVGGYKTNMIHGWEDWDFWLSLLEIGRGVHCIPEALFFYRVAEGSMLKSLSGEKERRMRLRLMDNHWQLYKDRTRIALTEKIVQMFVDTGDGFVETDSTKQVVFDDAVDLSFDLSAYRNALAVRLDPADDHAVVEILGVSARNRDGKWQDLAVFEDNALHKSNGRYLFATADPWISVKIPDSGIDRIRFSIRYIATGKDAYAVILDERFAVMEKQEAQIASQKKQIASQGHLIREQVGKLQLKDQLIRAKDVHIDNLETELNHIKSLLIWKLVNMGRLTKRVIQTLAEEGPGAVAARARNYLRRRRGRRKLETLEKDYGDWVKQHRITEDEIARMRKEQARFSYRPTISLVMPVYNVDQIWLEKAIESVLAQVYDNWELCMADDASTQAHVRETLDRYARKDPRIKIAYLDKNQGISLASNAALALATGEFVALLDNDDELTVDALFENIKLLNRHPDADMIYSDEDKLDIDGQRCEPHFKPDWAPDQFLSQMYTCHLGVYRKRLVDAVGGFRKGYEGSQDYDLVLRLIERTQKIHHIPKILYHWRIIPGSAAQSTHAKSYAYVAGKRALEDYVRRNRIRATVEDGLFVGSFRVRRVIEGHPEIGIIIPFKDKVSVLKTCVYSVLNKTAYDNYKILLVDNQSEEPETQAFLDDIVKDPRVAVSTYNRPFNFSAINNYAVSKLSAEYLLFLNNDTEVITEDWMTAMLEHAQRPEVGGVGALLYYPDDTVQHGGVILGLGGLAGHSHSRWQRDSCGYMGRLKVVNNLSAVTAACLMMRRQLFDEIQGYDENISHAFNDVDLCLKLRDRGYLIVYTPYAELYHHESLSRGFENTPEKKRRFNGEVEYVSRRWQQQVAAGDPYYNPNMTLKHAGFSVR